MPDALQMSQVTLLKLSFALGLPQKDYQIFDSSKASLIRFSGHCSAFLAQFLQTL